MAYPTEKGIFAETISNLECVIGIRHGVAGSSDWKPFQEESVFFVKRGKMEREVISTGFRVVYGNSLDRPVTDGHSVKNKSPFNSSILEGHIFAYKSRTQ